MKHTQLVNQKYRILRDQATWEKLAAIRKAHEEYNWRIDELSKQRQAEIDALPEAPVPERHREDRTPRYCATCGGLFVLATMENAKALAKIQNMRWNSYHDDDEDEDEWMPEEEDSDPETYAGPYRVRWNYRLASLRNPRKKYCCYACQVGRDDKHNWACVLQSELENDLREFGIQREGLELAMADQVSFPEVER